MSSAVSSSAAPSPSSGIKCNNLYNTPVQDVVCAMPYKDKYVDLMESCCGDADVVSYYNECGLYCLALDQTAEELTKCLYDGGAADADVFCRGDKNATATATDNIEPPASASAEVISDSGDDDNDNDDNDNDDSNDSNDSNSDNSNDDDDSAAVGVKPQSGMTVAGVVVGALLFSATFGAFQL